MHELVAVLLLATAPLCAPGRVVAVSDGPHPVSAAGTVPGLPAQSADIIVRVAEHPGGSTHAAAVAEDAWLGSDKFRHFLLSYAVTSFTFAGLSATGAEPRAALLGGVAGAAVAGIGKEIHDRRRGGLFSARDLVADAVGIATAYFLLREVR